MAWLTFLGAGILWSVIATVASIIAVAVIGFANVGAIIAAVVGPEVGATVLQLLGNLLYAGILGSMAANTYIQAFDRPDSMGLSLAIVGAVAALALVFGSVPFLVAFAPFIVDWLATLPELLATAILAALFGIGAAAAVGVVGTAMPAPAVE